MLVCEMPYVCTAAVGGLTLFRARHRFEQEKKKQESVTYSFLGQCLLVRVARAPPETGPTRGTQTPPNVIRPLPQTLACDSQN